MLVHRKGAIAAPLGGRALIPGSMGTASYLVEGLGEPLAFASASHGAGRVLTRREAREKVSPRRLEHVMRRVVVQALKDREALCVRIEGHTDGVGSAAQNLKLSQDRAAAVKAYLTQKGIADPRLVAKGYGQTLPLETNATPEGRERNRRVEFVLARCGADAP